MAKEKIETRKNPPGRKNLNAMLKEAERDPVFKERLYLVGHAVLEEAKRDPAFKKELYATLDGFLTRKEDRALFDLPPLRLRSPKRIKLK